jgi:hypothetical protein
MTWRTILLGALLVAVSSCGYHRAHAQALRTCVDRWNQGNMVGWGPVPANVAFRRPVAKERQSIELSSRRQCIVAIAAGGGTWTCLLESSGAYWCPPLHEPTGPPLKENARIDKYGVLVLDRPLKGTHATPPLRWHRYPVVDGYIQPWTARGALRAGLRFKGEGRGHCFLADDTANSAVSCLRPDGGRDAACFPRHRDGRRGDVAACSYGPGYTTFTRWTVSADIPNPPLLVPWRRIGHIFLGKQKARVIREYGGEPKLGYRLPGGTVQVGFDAGRVSTIWFSTPYYRTNGGFGVGSRIPLGPCHHTRTSRCEHRWHGFVWNAWVKEKPCSCWVKVGLGPKSLPATVDNFLKPWFFVNVRHGRVVGFYFASKFVD